MVERLCNLKPIEMKDDGDAEFELEMSLKDPGSKIFLYKVTSIFSPLNSHMTSYKQMHSLAYYADPHFV